MRNIKKNNDNHVEKYTATKYIAFTFLHKLLKFKQTYNYFN